MKSKKVKSEGEKFIESSTFKTVSLIATVALSGLMFIVGGTWFYRSQTISYTESLSGIEIPNGDLVPTALFGDAYQILEISVPKRKRAQFIADAGLLAVSPEAESIRFSRGFFDQFPNGPLIENSSTLYVQWNCTDGDAWQYLFDEESGYLWTIVLLFDPSGDSSDCYFETFP